MKKPDFNYYQYLINLVDGYNGENSEQINFTPQIYSLLDKLIDVDEIDEDSRRDIFVCMGYFLLSHDIVPEDIFGPKGLIDDLLLSLHVLNKIQDKYELDLIYDFWSSDYNKLKMLINEDFIHLKEKYIDIYKKTLKYTNIT